MKPRFPLYLKITAASFTVLLIVLGFLAAIAYRDQYRAVEDKFGLTLQHVAQTAALFLDGEAHERVHTNADVAGADFRVLREILDKVRKENGLKPDAIYTMRPLPSGEFEFVIMLQDKTFVGDKYLPPAHIRGIPAWVLKDGTPRYTDIYGDDHGTFVSAYAPIRNAAGKVVALLEVDYDVQRFLTELRKEGMKRIWTVPAALALSLVLSLLVAFSITKAVGRLVEGTSAIQAGRYDHKVKVETRDELRTLAHAFNQMVDGLRERFAMLKFVPRHTREVIADSVRSDASQNLVGIAQKRNVAVLFSDIRGFTAFSDRLPPAKVIEMLNIYLRKEAEIIEKNGGSIDKFIGDAVMAVFEGEQRFVHAAKSAIEIQVAIQQLNDEHAFDQPIDVGIGIAGGDVVMGSIGYEDRLEFAVIGRLVNLASRLTSVAGKGEVVVSDLAWASISSTFVGERLDGLKLKGFADAVTCFKLRPQA